MDNKLSLDKVILEHRYSDCQVSPNHEHIWKNILKIEALKKEEAIRKNQTMCQNLNLKIKI